MKKLLLPVAVIATLGFASCGGGNEDAEKFCKCFESDWEGDCEEQMEALESEFKKDEARYEAFAKAAKESCPDAEKWIKRLK